MLQGPAFPADSCVGTVGAGLGTWNKVQTWRGRQTAWNSYQMYPECASGMPGIYKSPGEAAQPPCPTSLPSSLWSPVLSSQSQEPLLTFFQTLDLLPSSLFPRCKPPKTLLPAELPGTKSVGLIPELAFLDLRYNFSPNTWVTGEVCPGSQVLPSQC